MKDAFPRLAAAEAAAQIQNGQTVAFSGFTPAGAAKEIPKAIAARAATQQSAGQPFRIGVITGASAGQSLDGSLARADAILFRTPYQNDPDLRKSINEGRTKFYVSHLDSSEHSVQVIITEQGVADLRGKCPAERAEAIIENCAHPDYRAPLRDYVALAGHAHSPATLKAAFAMHLAFAQSGDMRTVNWEP
jgi:acyl-CoA hydrolase